MYNALQEMREGEKKVYERSFLKSQEIRTNANMGSPIVRELFGRDRRMTNKDLAEAALQAPASLAGLNMTRHVGMPNMMIPTRRDRAPAPAPAPGASPEEVANQAAVILAKKVTDERQAKKEAQAHAKQVKQAEKEAKRQVVEAEKVAKAATKAAAKAARAKAPGTARSAPGTARSAAGTPPRTGTRSPPPSVAASASASVGVINPGTPAPGKPRSVSQLKPTSKAPPSRK